MERRTSIADPFSSSFSNTFNNASVGFNPFDGQAERNPFEQNTISHAPQQNYPFATQAAQPINYSSQTQKYSQTINQFNQPAYIQPNYQQFNAQQPNYQQFNTQQQNCFNQNPTQPLDQLSNRDPFSQFNPPQLSKGKNPFDPEPKQNKNIW